ncbi:hypothetical protein WIW50_00880 [Flavobacteriaceae bacterium 3-367]
MESVITIFLSLLAAYAGVGLLFGLYFFFKGAAQIDPVISDSKWTVRLLLIPGSIGLWPLLLAKLIIKVKA